MLFWKFWYIRTHPEELLLPKKGKCCILKRQSHFGGIWWKWKCREWCFESSYICENSSQNVIGVSKYNICIFQAEEFFGMSSYIYKNFQNIISHIFYFHAQNDFDAPKYTIYIFFSLFIFFSGTRSSSVWVLTYQNFQNNISYIFHFYHVTKKWVLQILWNIKMSTKWCFWPILYNFQSTFSQQVLTKCWPNVNFWIFHIK